MREYYRCMKPLWSNKGISLPLADIESETEMLGVAELLRYILRFRFTFMAGAQGLKNVPIPFCQSSKQTAEWMYNSTTQEHTQFIWVSVFLHF